MKLFYANMIKPKKGDKDEFTPAVRMWSSSMLMKLEEEFFLGNEAENVVAHADDEMQIHEEDVTQQQIKDMCVKLMKAKNNCVTDGKKMFEYR